MEFSRSGPFPAHVWGGYVQPGVFWDSFHYVNAFVLSRVRTHNGRKNEHSGLVGLARPGQSQAWVTPYVFILPWAKGQAGPGRAQLGSNHLFGVAPAGCFFNPE